MRRTMQGVYSIDVEKSLYENDIVFIRGVRREMGIVPAVKVVKMATGCTLMQAKQFVETFCMDDNNEH